MEEEDKKHLQRMIRISIHTSELSYSTIQECLGYFDNLCDIKKEIIHLDYLNEEYRKIIKNYEKILKDVNQ